MEVGSCRLTNSARKLRRTPRLSLASLGGQHVDRSFLRQVPEKASVPLLEPPAEGPVVKRPVMADSRDMFVIHQMFRREFSALPSLVSGVPAGAGARVAVVADHVKWMVTFLHTHHEGEDLLVWPKLLERGPAEIDPLVHRMEAQHPALAVALDDLGAKAGEWRKTSAVQQRGAVATAATDLLLRIAEHLDLEERKMLPLIDTYLTEKEWKQIGGHGLKEMSFGQLKVAFGTILYEATPDQVQIMRDTIPRPAWVLFSIIGPRAYAKYVRRLYDATDVQPDRDGTESIVSKPNDAVIAEFRANSESVTDALGSMRR